MEEIKVDIKKVKWVWNVFGSDLITVELPFDPPCWRRLITKIFLGSKWERK